MKITVTNGVNFALGTGNVCIVYFSNAIARTYSDDKSTNITINIGSTGAKEFRARYSTTNGHTERNVTSSWAIGNSTLLLMYSGTYYYTPSYGYTHSYDDYHEG